MELSKSNSPAMSENICLFGQAFLKAKKEFISTGLSGTNAHQKYKYAKIEDIYNAVEAALSKYDIAIWHFARPSTDGAECLFTRLTHVLSGQYIEDMRILESEKPGNQAKGAANTYMKKYAVLSLCAIATEDDDGEDEERYIAQKAKEPSISQEQIKELQSEIKAASNSKELYSNILRFNKIKDLNELKQSSFGSVRSYIINNKE